jgi:hypothetical protein
MKLLLLDNSITYFNENNFQFSDAPLLENVGTNYSVLYDLHKLIRYIEKPDKKFSSCFRRRNDDMRYSSIQTNYKFNDTFLEDIFELKLISGSGGLFSNSYKELEILDGKIIINIGYGFGYKTWTALEGYEVLRVTCLLLGIEQPKKIKGEIAKRNLSEILKDLSKYKVKERAFNRWNCPWKRD